MPTYSYACTACDHKFAAVQAFTDDALTTCPECSGRLRKLFNSVGVVFKGSGFYRTDSRESQKSSASASGGSGSTTGSDKSAPAAAPAPAHPRPRPAAARLSTGSPLREVRAGIHITSLPAWATR